MGTAWIKVFVLTLSECIAPPGKTVCQENQFELEFLTRADCEAALEELVALKEASPDVIVDKADTMCRASAREREVFATLAEVSGSVDDKANWREPPAGQQDTIDLRERYEERLAGLRTCEETGGAAPCKMGQIILEGATGEPVEVWRSRN
ncbi:MAG: hypothetical protein R3176_11220 [Woeseiaceae bacterium]|nr:hypothetical protein [Woeseiaceae bacterium]